MFGMEKREEEGKRGGGGGEGGGGGKREKEGRPVATETLWEVLFLPHSSGPSMM